MQPAVHTHCSSQHVYGIASCACVRCQQRCSLVDACSSCTQVITSPRKGYVSDYYVSNGAQNKC